MIFLEGGSHAADHLEAPVIRQRGDFLDLGMLDMDVRLAFELQYQLADAADAALDFQKHPPVGQVAHPAGQIQVPRQIIRRVAEAHVLYPAGKNDPPSRLRSFHGISSINSSARGAGRGRKMAL